MVSSGALTAGLTAALEDYLETILILVRKQGFARVRDIARAREVKSSSVTPALKRLADLGLARYVKREYVDLTDAGKQAARRILARHDLLTRFFSQFLQMPPDDAAREACAMEHSLSPEAMDRLVRFFEFVQVCPELPGEWLEKFHCCSRVQHDVSACEQPCVGDEDTENRADEKAKRVSELQPGERGTVNQVNAGGAIRQRLLDMGLLPGVVVRVERLAPAGASTWRFVPHGARATAIPEPAARALACVVLLTARAGTSRNRTKEPDL